MGNIATPNIIKASDINDLSINSLTTGGDITCKGNISVPSGSVTANQYYGSVNSEGTTNSVYGCKLNYISVMYQVLTSSFAEGDYKFKDSYGIYRNAKDYQFVTIFFSNMCRAGYCFPVDYCLAYLSTRLDSISLVVTHLWDATKNCGFKFLTDGSGLHIYKPNGDMNSELCVWFWK